MIKRIGVERLASESTHRKTPRIISRSRFRSLPKQSSHLHKKGVRHRDSSSVSQSDSDDELGSGFIVRGGVVISTTDNNPSSSQRVVEVADIHSHPGERLPGVADEVESYPCRFCPDRVFLTSYTLDRHAKTVHPERYDEIIEDISAIYREWRRRNDFTTEAKRRRNIMNCAIADVTTEISGRQGSIGAANLNYKRRAVRESFQPYDMRNKKLREQEVAHASTMSSDVAKGFVSCQICDIQISLQHTSAMINHMRAHKKNDELRSHLITELGPEYVAMCTCRKCYLVFTDVKKLSDHIESTHMKRRSYICKWCGELCPSMANLNLHKKMAHGCEQLNSIVNSDETKGNISQELANTSLNSFDRSKTTTSGLSTEEYCDFDNSVAEGPPIVKKQSSFYDQNACNTKCEICDLVMVKPSLLIRHMQRVHAKHTFTAVIQVRGKPDIKVDMDRSRVTWWCCEMPFNDRHKFISHRKLCHHNFFPFQNCSRPQQLHSYVQKGTASIEDDEIDLLSVKARKRPIQDSCRYTVEKGCKQYVVNEQSESEMEHHITRDDDEFGQSSSQCDTNVDDNAQYLVNKEVKVFQAPVAMLESVSDLGSRGMIKEEYCSRNVNVVNQKSSSSFINEIFDISSSVLHSVEREPHFMRQLPSESLVHLDSGPMLLSIDSEVLGSCDLMVRKPDNMNIGRASCEYLSENFCNDELVCNSSNSMAGDEGKVGQFHKKRSSNSTMCDEADRTSKPLIVVHPSTKVDSRNLPVVDSRKANYLLAGEEAVHYHNAEILSSSSVHNDRAIIVSPFFVKNTSSRFNDAETVNSDFNSVEISEKKLLNVDQSTNLNGIEPPNQGEMSVREVSDIFSAQSS